MKNFTLSLLLCFSLTSCMFIGLSEDVRQLNASVNISGRIESVNNNNVPIIVTLSRPENKEYKLQSYTVIYGENDFLLTVPKGNYYLLAFADKNRDFILQENERVGWFGSPTLLSTKGGQEYSDIIIKLKDSEQVKKDLPELFAVNNSHKKIELEYSNLGKIVDISNFKPEIGPLGMWNPVKFHQQGYSGIYFLENYDPNKIPVLFVHGISGSGYDWLYQLNQLDREKFQPWIVQYPSGIRLDLLSKSFSQSVDELKAKYNFESLAVVAHSMGGLVSRGFVNYRTSSHKTTDIISFITISTPWLGHNAARQGAKYAPVAVPSWFDLVPGSPYLDSLHMQPLDKSIDFHLLFSHKGDEGFFGGANSDGTVTLRSQLYSKAQEEAIKVVGYDEGHVGILNNLDVAEKLNKLLSDAAIKKSKVSN